MKIKRITKNACYAKGYGGSFRTFKRLVRSSPDNNIKRINARKLKQIWVNTLLDLTSLKYFA